MICGQISSFDLPAFETSFISLTQSCDLLDEDCHLVLLDGATVVLVELLEARLEVLIRECSSVAAFHVNESLLDERFGLLFVEGTGVVLVVLGPYVVYALFDHCVDIATHLKCFWNYN